jgi:VWFA-related protein
MKSHTGNRLRCLPQVLCLALQLSLSGFGQQPDKSKQKPATPRQTESQQPARSGEDDVVRITTNLVQIDPVITDKNGKQVTDLRPDEVQILEDGKPQKITNFSYIALDSRVSRTPEPARPVDKNAPPVPPVRLRPDQVRRTMALVVDDLGLSFESSYSVRQALKKFIDQQMQPDDLVAIIRTGGGIGALQQFTSDKRQLFAAIEKVKWNPMGRGGVGAFAPISSDALARSSSTDDERADPTAKEDDERADRTAREDDQFREDLFAVGTLGAVNYIVKGLRELPGRKSIVLISDGFKIFNRSDPLGSGRILTALRHLTDLANRASVVIYTLDARGLQSLVLNAADDSGGMTADQIKQSLSNRRLDFFESQSGLIYLAQQTGGLAFRNNNDLNNGIKRVVEDQRGYYLIGYRPDESTFEKVSGRGKFHKLSLKLTRPGKFNIRMRNGFYGITDEEAMPGRLTRSQQLIGALISPFGSFGVHVRLTSLFANDAKFGSIMRSMLHINGSDLTFTDEPDGWHQAAFDILAITFGDNGVVVDQIGRTHTLKLKGKTYERVLNEGFTYNITVPIKKAGAYQLRTALRDVASERVGSAGQFIEVPDVKKHRLTLSGVLIKGITPEAYQKAGRDIGSQGENSDDTLDESDPNASPAVRQFKSGLIMVYGYAIYNAQLDKATGKPQVQTQWKLFRDGQEVFVAKELAFDPSNQPDLKRLMANGALQLGSKMEPGEYVLQLIVTDLLRNNKYRVASQWVDFEIVK